MVSFELGKAIEKKFFFFVLSRAWDKEKILSPLRNRTSDLRIPRSDALPLSHRDSTMSVRLLFFQIIKTFRLNLPSILAIFTYETTRVREIKESFLIP